MQWMTLPSRSTAEPRADVPVADVVGHDDEDIGPLRLLRRSDCAKQRCQRDQASSLDQAHFSPLKLNKWSACVAFRNPGKLLGWIGEMRTLIWGVRILASLPLSRG
jgi:hypothetical protein